MSALRRLKSDRHFSKRKQCLALLMLVSGTVWAATEPTLSKGALQIIRHLAIQHNGRHKPFDSFAREAVQSITGISRVGHEDPLVTVLAILADPERWQAEPLISVPFVPMREALGMNPKATHISYNDLLATRKLMRLLPAIVEKQERSEKLSMLDNETMDVFQRFVTLSALFEQRLELVPPPPGALSGDWLPILQPSGYPDDQQATLRSAWQNFVTTLHDRSPQAIDTSASQLTSLLRAANPAAYSAPWRLRLEVFYNQARPFQLARMFYALAALVLAVGLIGARHRVLAAGSGMVWIGFAIHGAGILMRVVLGGRPPVSNFFETMLWLPFVAVALSLIFEQVYRVGYFGLASALLASITLLIADYVPLDSSISPVVAVLHSNLWLTVHVLTIVASYGALALATMLAHVYGTLYLTRRGVHPALASLDIFLYRTIQVGVVLLAGGIMLGAVWANASWGRYWGWDPKETWALITLLWFLAVLHGRFAGWIQGVGLALATIGGFFLLLMTYYGVSFYLVGLHSYAGGHAKPLPLLLIGYLLAEVAFLFLVGTSVLFRKRLPQD